MAGGRKTDAVGSTQNRPSEQDVLEDKRQLSQEVENAIAAGSQKIRGGGPVGPDLGSHVDQMLAEKEAQEAAAAQAAAEAQARAEAVAAAQAREDAIAQQAMEELRRQRENKANEKAKRMQEQAAKPQAAPDWLPPAPKAPKQSSKSKSGLAPKVEEETQQQQQATSTNEIEEEEYEPIDPSGNFLEGKTNGRIVDAKTGDIIGVNPEKNLEEANAAVYENGLQSGFLDPTHPAPPGYVKPEDVEVPDVINGEPEVIGEVDEDEADVQSILDEMFNNPATVPQTPSATRVAEQSVDSFQESDGKAEEQLDEMFGEQAQEAWDVATEQEQAKRDAEAARGPRKPGYVYEQPHAKRDASVARSVKYIKRKRLYIQDYKTDASVRKRIEKANERIRERYGEDMRGYEHLFVIEAASISPDRENFIFYSTEDKEKHNRSKHKALTATEYERIVTEALFAQDKYQWPFASIGRAKLRGTPLVGNAMPTIELLDHMTGKGSPFQDKTTKEMVAIARDKYFNVTKKFIDDKKVKPTQRAVLYDFLRANLQINGQRESEWNFPADTTYLNEYYDETAAYANAQGDNEFSTFAEQHKEWEEKVARGVDKAFNEYDDTEILRDKNGNVVGTIYKEEKPAIQLIRTINNVRDIGGVVGNVLLIISGKMELGVGVVQQKLFNVGLIHDEQFELKKEIVDMVAGDKFSRSAMEGIGCLIQYDYSVFLEYISTRDGSKPITAEEAKQFIAQHVARHPEEQSKFDAFLGKLENVEGKMAKYLGGFGFKPFQMRQFMLNYMHQQQQLKKMGKSYLTAEQVEAAIAGNPAAFISQAIDSMEGVQAFVITTQQSMAAVNNMTDAMSSIKINHPILYGSWVHLVGSYPKFKFNSLTRLFPLTHTAQYLITTKFVDPEFQSYRTDLLMGANFAEAGEWGMGLRMNLKMDAAQFASRAMLVIPLMALAQGLEPPEEEELIGDPEEWTWFGQKIKDAWWLNDVTGASIAFVVGLTASTRGYGMDTGLNIFMNGLYTHCFEPTIAADMLTLVLDWDAEWEKASSMEYLDGGAPTFQEFLIGQGIRLGSDVVKGFVPSVINDIFNGGNYWPWQNEHRNDPSRIYGENGSLVYTNYLDYVTRGESGTNTLFGLIMDVFNTSWDNGKTPYSRWWQPDATKIEPAQSTWVERFKITDLTDEDECYRVGQDVCNVMETFGWDPKLAAEAGVVIPPEARAAASRVKEREGEFYYNIYKAALETPGVLSYNGLTFEQNQAKGNDLKEEMLQLKEICDYQANELLYSDEIPYGAAKQVALSTSYQTSYHDKNGGTSNAFAYGIDKIASWVTGNEPNVTKTVYPYGDKNATMEPLHVVQDRGTWNEESPVSFVNEDTQYDDAFYDRLKQTYRGQTVQYGQDEGKDILELMLGPRLTYDPGNPSATPKQLPSGYSGPVYIPPGAAEYTSEYYRLPPTIGLRGYEAIPAENKRDDSKDLKDSIKVNDGLGDAGEYHEMNFDDEDKGGEDEGESKTNKEDWNTPETFEPDANGNIPKDVMDKLKNAKTLSEKLPFSVDEDGNITWNVEKTSAQKYAGDSNWYYSGSGRYYGGRSGSTYAPKIYATKGNSINAKAPATMYAKTPYKTNTDYLRPSFETKGSREAYKREDI